MTPQTNNLSDLSPANPNPGSWLQSYGQMIPPDPNGPKIKVLCKRTIILIEATGTTARHLQIEAKPGIQEVDAWIQNTETWRMGTQDGSIILVTGKSTLDPQLEPPTVAHVIAARKCSTEEAQRIVDIETVKFNQGEYPYPVKGAVVVPEPAVSIAPEPVRPQPPTLDQVMSTGYRKAAAEKIVAAEQKKFEAGVFPYGPTADPKYWGTDLDAEDNPPGADPTEQR